MKILKKIHSIRDLKFGYLYKMYNSKKDADPTVLNLTIHCIQQIDEDYEKLRVLGVTMDDITVNEKPVYESQFILFENQMTHYRILEIGPKETHPEYFI